MPRVSRQSQSKARKATSTPRSTTANKQPKQPAPRQPPAFVEALIEKYTQYAVIGGAASLWLRNRYPGGRWRIVEDMWDEVKAEWYSDPVNLSVQPTKGDQASHAEFWRKCTVLCHERTPKDARDHIKMFLSAGTTVTYFVSTEVGPHPKWKAYISSEANIRAMKILSQLPEYDGNLQIAPVISAPPTTTTAADSDKNSSDLYRFLNKTIHCTDGSSFVVEDCGNSAVKGDFFVVRDTAGQSQTLSREYCTYPSTVELLSCSATVSFTLSLCLFQSAYGTQSMG